MLDTLETKIESEKDVTFTQALAPKEWRSEKDIEATSYLPRVSKEETLKWTSNPLYENRKSERLYREKEVGDVIKQIGKADTKSVLLEGEGGAGKTTTILEMDHLLEEQNIPHALFSPKEWSMALEIHDAVDFTFENTIEGLKKYCETSDAQAIVLIDSGDYMFRPISFVKKSPNEERYYNQMLDLMHVLQNPQFKIVTTWHPDWDPRDRDKTLFDQWRQLFPEESEYKISNKVEPVVGVDMIIDQNKIILDESNRLEERGMLHLIAERLNNLQMKKLQNEQFQVIKDKLKNIPIGQWEKEIDDWTKTLK